MGKLGPHMKAYTAPDGFVYDYKEPHLNEDEELHMYSKYLFITKYDNIDNYKLIEDPRVGVDNAQ